MSRSFQIPTVLLFLVSVARAEVDYVRDIKPLMEDRCNYCHGASDQKAGLRTDAGTLLQQGGDRGVGVVEGKSSESLLLQAITGKADFARMPLDDDPLSDEEIALIREWIDGGAKFPEDEEILPAEKVTTDHWAFLPVERSEPPTILSEFVRTPIDAFVLSRLMESGLEPSAEAPRHVLIRRLYLDLLGVLPSPEEVEEFCTSESPTAYEELVDRLLASPYYGERWGRHWLDAARYADSNGFTIDGPRDMWKYRDWVISAMNADLPFDEFTIEQLAGDMLDNPTMDQRVATGFHRNTLANQEGGTDDEQFRNEAVVDRVNTTGTVWLGLTVGCSQCHDHKYDPVSQRDYYRLFAIFNNTADNNDARGLAPKVSLPSPEQSELQSELQSQLKVGKRTQAELEKELKAKQAEWIESLGAVIAPPEWTVVNGNAVSTDGQTLEAIGEGAFVARADVRPKHDTYQVTFDIPEGQKVSAIRLEALTHESLPGKGPGTAGNGNFVLSGVRLKDANGQQLAWSRAQADHSQKGYDVSGAIDDDAKTGWAINVEKGSMNVPRTARFVLAEPASAGPFTFELEHRCPPNAQYLIGSFRVSYTGDAIPVDSLDDELKSILAVAEGERSDKQRAKLDELQRQANATWHKQDQALKELQGRLDTLSKSIPTSLVMEELPEPRETFIQIRGDFLSHGARVTPGIPAVFESDDADHKTRLDFARWLVSDNQPLTARVTVNRIWQRLFGRGLVETENDFGLQGTPPSHPELLDWLASEFMRQEWSLKELKRTIVLSSVYRQDSVSRKDLEEVDPRNVLLGRQNRVRLDAEIIRDAALTSSGRLTSVLYGPPVHPPQPEGIYVLTQNKKSWPDEKGPNRYRRSLYTYFWRSSPHPMFPTFDAPDATTTCTRRNRSNTPLQALTLANDRGFVELAQGFAQRVLTNASGDDAERIRYAFDVALSREPSAAEQQRLQEMLSTARAYFQTNEEEARQAAGDKVGGDADTLVESAAWSSVCRVLLNLDEFYTRE